MKKKISIKYYKDDKSSEIVEIDYNTLNTHYHTKEGKLTRLLGSNEDRIEAYLIRKNYTKINVALFTKIKETLDGTQV